VGESIIRPAQLTDVPALADLAKRTWSDAFGSSVSPEEETAELEKTRSETYFADALQRDTILVAGSDEKLLGYVQFGDVDTPGVEVRPGDQELHRVYVETALHRQGVGRRLMNSALEHPRLAGAGRIYLTVWEKNERAISLYESLGFRRVGTTTVTIGAGEVAEDLVMLLDRGAPALQHSTMDDVLAAVLADAESDTNVIGVFLKGSRAVGTDVVGSDWDVVVVLREGEASQRKDGVLDVLRTTLARVQNAPRYELPAIAHARVLLDKTGEVAETIEAAARIGRDELAELYDSYLNDFYRSLKAWARGQELAARLKASRSIWWLGEFLLGLDGRRAPYPGAWAGRLGELEPLVLDVLRTGDPRRQQELQAKVEQIATARGFRYVYEGWTGGEIDRVMALRFE
jgi:diamine N-acetyltransferase